VILGFPQGIEDHQDQMWIHTYQAIAVIADYDTSGHREIEMIGEEEMIGMNDDMIEIVIATETEIDLTTAMIEVGVVGRGVAVEAL